MTTSLRCLQPGDLLYEKARPEKRSKSKIIQVVSVHVDGVRASVNGKPVVYYSLANLTRWRKNPPKGFTFPTLGGKIVPVKL